MKNFKKKHFIGVIVLVFILSASGLYSLKCHGNECVAEKSENKINQNNSVVNPEIIQKQLKNNTIVVLDVRENSEWNVGHIDGAVHIPLGNLDIETTKKLSKDIPIYVYCRSGRRAGEAEIKLKSLGFDNTRNIGGIIEWQEKGGTLVSK